MRVTFSNMRHVFSNMRLWYGVLHWFSVTFNILYNILLFGTAKLVIILKLCKYFTYYFRIFLINP